MRAVRRDGRISVVGVPISVHVDAVCCVAPRQHIDEHVVAAIVAELVTISISGKIGYTPDIDAISKGPRVLDHYSVVAHPHIPAIVRISPSSATTNDVSRPQLI